MSGPVLYLAGGQADVLDAGAAVRRAGVAAEAPVQDLARGLLAGGADAVLVASEEGDAWLDSAHASGWVAGAAPSMAPALAEACRRHRGTGWVPADAILLALAEGEDGHCRGMPALTWGGRRSMAVAGRMPEVGLYAIVDSVPRLRAVVDAGVPTVQLRIKQPADADAAWSAALRTALREANEACRGAGSTLVVNDHWRLAAELGAPAVHLGQEDLGGLAAGDLAALAASGMALGVSSHSMWELCRARSLQPASIACGPVWPTTTKDMPWRPQGLDNLAWWCAHAGTQVTAIGGILSPDQVRLTAAAGASGVCVLRGLGEEPRRLVPALLEAFAQGRSERSGGRAPAWPHPTLEAGR